MNIAHSDIMLYIFVSSVLLSWNEFLDLVCYTLPHPDCDLLVSVTSSPRKLVENHVHGCLVSSSSAYESIKEIKIRTELDPDPGSGVPSSAYLVRGRNNF